MILKAKKKISDTSFNFNLSQKLRIINQKRMKGIIRTSHTIIIERMKGLHQSPTLKPREWINGIQAFVTMLCNVGFN